VITLEVADLVVIASRTLGLDTGEVLDLLDPAAADRALALVRPGGGPGDPAGLAAALLHALVRERPLRHGNDQVALAAMLQFLGLNGWELDPDPPGPVAAVVAELAAGTLDVRSVADWLAPRLRPSDRAGTSGKEAPVRRGSALASRRPAGGGQRARGGSPRNVRLTVAAATATLLASIALYPLMSGGKWFWAGLGAVIVVGAIGAATRRRAIPAILCFAAMIAGEFVYLNILFARHWSLAGLVPTGASVHHLRLLVAQAAAETSRYAPPIPPRPGMVLVTAAGIGLVAALTDVLAVRLHRPAIAGLPLLFLFCVPLTTDARPGAVGGALVFCAGVVGYLGLLSAGGRHRLRLWGRLVGRAL